MLKDESMLHFKSILGFSKFYENLSIKREWKIRTGILNKRGESIAYMPYTTYLRNRFAECGLFRRNVSIAEIVSWLDSYVIIKRLVEALQTSLPNDTISQIELICEYRIRMSKNRRIDYIFKFKNRVLLCEFRLSDKFPNVSNTWQKKELELIIYKELLNNYMADKYKIIVYAFIAMPEYNGSTPIPKNIKYNKDNITHFAEYITQFLVQQNNRANLEGR